MQQTARIDPALSVFLNRVSDAENLAMFGENQILELQ